MFKALISTSLLVFTSAALADQPNPNEVWVNAITSGGTGCPAGTMETYLSEDRQAFTLIFDAYVAEAGLGIPASSSRKFCNINLDLHIPHGWQYTVFKVDYYGFADIPAGGYGQQKSRYCFAGAASSQGVTLQTTIRGPYTNNYEAHDQLGITSLVWSPCGVSRALNIKSEAFVRTSGGRSALMTVDTIEGEFRQVYAVQWRRC